MFCHRDGAAGILFFLPPYAAAAGIRTHVSRVAPSTRDLNPGDSSNLATTTSALSIYLIVSLCLTLYHCLAWQLWAHSFLLLQYFQLENLRERIEEESEKKSDALKALSKAQAEIQLWRSKFETEGLGRIDDLESSKQKLAGRVTEAEETIETLNQKIVSTEKTKHRLEAELEDLQLEYERVHAAAVITEKRGKNFDKVHLTNTL